MNVALVHPVWRTPNQLDSFYPGRVYWAYTLKEFFQEHIKGLDIGCTGSIHEKVFQEHIKNLGVAAFEDEMVCCNIYIYVLF